MIRLPQGFQVAGFRSGIKRNKPDTALIHSEKACTAAARVTTNRARAACCRRTAEATPGGNIQAIIAVSGNANALSGARGLLADQRLAAAAAAGLNLDPSQVLTACTGVVGSVLAVEHVERALPNAVGSLGSSQADVSAAARAMMTTDRRPKAFATPIAVTVDNTMMEGTLSVIAKGSGMIHPNLGTTLVFVMTDLPVSSVALDIALGFATQQTIEQLTVDGDQSTNDSVIALANGAVSGPAIEPGSTALDVLCDELTALLREVSRAIARDGEGASRLLTVDIDGAPDTATAQAVARTVCGSNLVKSAVFGADPSWGRIASAAGQALAHRDVHSDPATWRLKIQNTDVFKHGEPVPFERRELAARLDDEEVYIHFDLGSGTHRGTAWGCDLSYEYVKINADYAAAVGEDAKGTVGLEAQLAVFSPKVKRALIMQALGYIERFRGQRIVLKVAGALIDDTDACTRVAEDLVMLRSVGMNPVVIHGGSEAITKALAARGRVSDFVDGHRVTPPEDADIVEMVLLGQVNRKLANRINAVGGKAVGLSGADAGVLRATPLEEGLGAMGRVASVDTDLIDSLTERGYIPVIAPVGSGADGMTWNLDGEDAAAAVAAAFRAFKLVFLLGGRGLVDGGTRVSTLSPRRARRMLRDGSVDASLVHIVEAGLNAVHDGVERVHLVDGRVAHNLISELFTDAGTGTLMSLDD